MKRLLLLLPLLSVLQTWAQFSTVPGQLPSQESPIYSTSDYSIFPRSVVWGSHRAEVLGDSVVLSSFENRSWHRSKNLSQYPSLHSDLPILDALHCMTVEELDNLIEQDSTWRTGKWWGGVWTRDISYSTLLAAAYMQPDVTRISLMKKVSGDGRIIEDTGTGGSWPVSTDRVVWVLAAWQLYLATGDMDWLRTCYPIVKNTLLQDVATVYDPATGLFKGESSFLDWREETYPRWMEPADISQSECLGTNALFCQAFHLAAEMARIMGDTLTEQWCDHSCSELRNAINRNLWLDDKGYYAQYLYGRAHKIASPRSETLGEALCILFDIASPQQAERILCSVNLNPLGTPCISPQIPNVYPYHNNAVWPFVQAFWMQASAKMGHETSLNHSIGAILRAAATFATNQENFVASNGDYHTAMNSPNMLWSINGQLSIVHSVFAGIRLLPQGLRFEPFVPKAWDGTYLISHFRLRGADLDIIVEGHGSRLNDVVRNGRACPEIYLDDSLCDATLNDTQLRGRHTIRMVLDGREPTPKSVNLTEVQTSPETSPEVYLESSRRLAWRQVPDAAYYKILRNGQLFATQEERIINSNRLDIPLPDGYAEYQVVAVDGEGREGFASEPLPYYAPEDLLLFDMTSFSAPTAFAPCWGWSGRGAVETSSLRNRQLVMKIEVPRDGDYLIDFRYANGSGDLLGYNMCCNRTLWVDGNLVGTLIFPQRGQDLWQLWGYSSKLIVRLSQGKHRLLLSYEPNNRNMNVDDVNRAMLDQLRLIRMESR